ncbi:T-cell immunomodulatory protein [Liparis tanakae]|uniref:T-cell immunomodulatory protein n=1 Tax=Liparis tanakae TaxID=230148 RepID=A0A4Z2HR98_9TELE|nr:T-cell immunomodulatory protein [Liparis tanakae]
MIPDIFGVVTDSTPSIFTEVCTLTKRIPVWQKALSSSVNMRTPHSNAFIDLNKDFTAVLLEENQRTANQTSVRHAGVCPNRHSGEAHGAPAARCLTSLEPLASRHLMAFKFKPTVVAKEKLNLHNYSRHLVIAPKRLVPDFSRMVSGLNCQRCGTSRLLLQARSGGPPEIMLCRKLTKSLAGFNSSCEVSDLFLTTAGPKFETWISESPGLTTGN